MKNNNIILKGNIFKIMTIILILKNFIIIKKN